MTSKPSKPSVRRAQCRVRTLALAVLACYPAMSSHGAETGIKVHGDWVITVHDRDGNLVQSTEFKNALTEIGQRVLFGLLTSNSQVGKRDGGAPAWAITADGDGVLGLGAENQECYERVGPFFSSPYGDAQAASLSPAEAFPSTATSFTLTRSFAMPERCVTGETYSINVVSSGLGIQSLENPSQQEIRSFSRKELGNESVTGIFPEQTVTLKVTFSFN